VRPGFLVLGELQLMSWIGISLDFLCLRPFPVGFSGPFFEGNDVLCPFAGTPTESMTLSTKSSPTFCPFFFPLLAQITGFNTTSIFNNVLLFPAQL